VKEAKQSVVCLFLGLLTVSFPVIAGTGAQQAPVAAQLARNAMASHFKLDADSIQIDALRIHGPSAVVHTSAGDNTCMFNLVTSSPGVDADWQIVRRACEQSSPTDVAVAMIAQFTGDNPEKVEAEILKYVDGSAIVETRSHRHSCLLEMDRTPAQVNGWRVGKAQCKQTIGTKVTALDSAT